MPWPCKSKHTFPQNAARLCTVSDVPSSRLVVAYLMRSVFVRILIKQLSVSMRLNDKNRHNVKR